MFEPGVGKDGLTVAGVPLQFVEVKSRAREVRAQVGDLFAEDLSYRDRPDTPEVVFYG